MEKTKTPETKETIPSPEDGLCDYCGEEKATTVIGNPNDFEEAKERLSWKVCKGCKLTIREQQKLSLGSVLMRMDDEISKEHGERIVKEATENINQIEIDTGKPTFSGVIEKMEDGKYKSRRIK